MGNGGKMSNLRRISKEDYYKIIKNWAKENGRSPTKKDFNDNPDLPSPRTLEENIKVPWNIALKELGLEQIKDRTYYLLMDKKELLEAFKMEYLKVNPKNRTDFNSRRNRIFPESTYVEKKLDTNWNGLLKKCKFDLKREIRTKEEYVKILKGLYNKLGKVPSISDFQKAGYNLGSLLYSFNLKTYNEVMKELGYSTNKAPITCNYTDLELIDMYKDLCSNIGDVATVYDIDKCKSIPNSSVFLDRFTDIKNLRKLANIQGGRVRNNKYTQEYIIKILTELLNKYNRPLTTKELQKEIKDNNYPSIRTMQRHLNVKSVKGLWEKVQGEL